MTSMRAIDFHVHLPTPDWLDGSMEGYVEAAEAYFRSTVQRQSLGELADKYRALDAKAVLLAWDGSGPNNVNVTLYPPPVDGHLPIGSLFPIVLGVWPL
jgi:hypothetical protein